MAFRSDGTPFSFVLGGALVLSLGFAACGSYVPAHAADPNWVPVEIRNGDFGSPGVTGKATKQVPDFWVSDKPEGPGTALTDATDTGNLVIPQDLAAHQQLQAVGLNYVTGTGTAVVGKAGILQTRLWGVRKGTDVEVSYDVTTPTATMIPGCTLAVKNYTVSSSDSSGEYQPEPKLTLGTAVWQTEVYKFKAAEENPKLVFTSNDKDTMCGAVIANVTAKADSNTFPTPDQFIKRNSLPWRIYQGVKEVSWDVMKKDLIANQEIAPCVDNRHDPSTSADCTFTVDPSRTYSYFAESRILGSSPGSSNASLNCTRGVITDSRTVSWTEEGFDPFNQVANRPKPGVEQKPDNTGSDDYELGKKDSGATGLAAVSTGAVTRFNAVQAGFQKYETNKKLANTETPLISSRKPSHPISIQIQPGEASWIEVQAARERIGGYFSTGMNTLIAAKPASGGKGGVPAVPAVPAVTYWFVIDTMLDFPSSKIADRLFQRTGPMTSTEQDHCLTGKPDMVTPDNNGTSAIRPKPSNPTTQSLAPDRNLVSVEATPGDRKTRSVLLTP